MQIFLKNCFHITRYRRKKRKKERKKKAKENTEKRERTTKMGKKLNSNDQYVLNFTFLYRKIYILLENMFGKT